MAQLSPEEHLKNATALTEKIFEDEMKRPMDKKKSGNNMNIWLQPGNENKNN